MKNSTRSINFTLALMGALTSFYFIISRFTIESYFSQAEIALVAMALFCILVEFPTIQAVLRYFEIRPYYHPDRLFLKVALGEMYIQQMALGYVIIILTHFLMYLKTGAAIPKEAYMWALIWFIVFEATIVITHMTTYAYIMGDGIVIKGLDLRIDIPLSDPLISHSGVYTYDHFDTFSVRGNKFTLHMPGKIGQIKMIIPEDKIPHISSFLSAKGLKLENPKG